MSWWFKDEPEAKSARRRGSKSSRSGKKNSSSQNASSKNSGRSRASQSRKSGNATAKSGAKRKAAASGWGQSKGKAVRAPAARSKRQVANNQRRRGAQQKPRRPAQRRGSQGRRVAAQKQNSFGIFKLAYWGCVAGIWGAIAFGALIFYFSITLPNPLIAGLNQRGQSIRVLARDGSLLAERGLFKNYVSLKKLPPHIKNAVIAIEDRRFYYHPGFDPIGFTRAMVHNVRLGRLVQGGSTITQQLAKNLFLNSDRTVSRKLSEMGMALWLEYKFNKDEILELYLNRVYFGHQAFGIGQAARRYFGKEASELNLSEAAMLAGLLKAPSRLNPKRNYKAAKSRANVVLSAMKDAGFISPMTMKTASLTPAQVQRRTLPINSNYIADWIAELVPEYVTDFTSDLVIETSIERSVQSSADKVVMRQLKRVGQSRKVSQAAVVVLSTDGAVRALVGGRDYQKSQFNRAIHAKRQMGSVFKPVVYLSALEAGFRPSSIIVDEPTTFNNWRPKNYHNKYRGRIQLSTALAVSSNVAAVKLMGTVGVAKTVETARRLGLRGSFKRDLSMALGTGEQSLLNVTASYAPFANGGRGVVPFVITRISTRRGRLLYRHRAHSLGQVIEARHVNEMNDMLRLVVKQGTGKRARLGKHDFAGKTGTTQKSRDAWFIGYSGYFITGVWVGNDDGTPMKNITGGGLPISIWSDVMKVAHEGKSPRLMMSTSREAVRLNGWKEVGVTRRIRAQFFEKALR